MDKGCSKQTRDLVDYD